MKLLQKLENGKALIYAHNVLNKDKEFVKLLFKDLELKSLEDVELLEDVLEYMDEDLFKEKDLALVVLDKFFESIEGLVNSIEKDDEEALDDILDVYEDFFEELSDDLRADKEVVLKMGVICDYLYKTITEENGYSDDVVEECVDFIEDCFEEVDESLFWNNEFLEELTEVCPSLSEFDFKDEEDDDSHEDVDGKEDVKECSCGHCDCEDDEKCSCGDECNCGEECSCHKEKECSCEDECSCEVKEEKIVEEENI